jgi:hypothetical protein
MKGLPTMNIHSRGQRSSMKEYQNLLCDELSRIYPTVEVVSEWASMKDEMGIYSPRVDVAVGPFATQGICIEQYNQLMDDSQDFIIKLINYHSVNIRAFTPESKLLTFNALKHKNSNARCLLAIEIENSGSRKHIIGDVVNASALGRVGIFIAWTPEKLRAVIKMRRYLQFLKRVGKNTFNTTNLLILDKNQFLQAVLDN